MLLVTSSMRMLDGVHGHTSNSGPVASLGFVLVPGVGGLEHGLIGSLTSGADSDHGSAVSEHGLSGSGRKSDSGLLSIVGVSDDDGGAAGSSGEATSVTNLTLAVGHDGTLRKGVDGENVSDGEGGCREVSLLLINFKKTYLCFQRRRIGQCTFPRRRQNTQFFACICKYL